MGVFLFSPSGLNPIDVLLTLNTQLFSARKSFSIYIPLSFSLSSQMAQVDYYCWPELIFDVTCDRVLQQVLSASTVTFPKDPHTLSSFPCLPSPLFLSLFVPLVLDESENQMYLHTGILLVYGAIKRRA